MVGAVVSREESTLYSAARAHFGRYYRAAAEIGVEPSRRSRWTRADLRARLRELQSMGKPMSVGGLGAGLRTACIRHFGSFRAGLLSAGVVDHAAQIGPRKA